MNSINRPQSNVRGTIKLPYPTPSSSRATTPSEMNQFHVSPSHGRRRSGLSDISMHNNHPQLSTPPPSRNISGSDRLEQTKLLTPVSNFPSRVLPPLGTKGLDLDEDITLQTFRPGQKVRVRRFLGERKGWTPWKEGIVIKQESIISFAGAHGNGYLVSVKADDGSYEKIPTSFAAFYAEICSADSSHCPEIDPKVCARRRQQSDMVYAKLPVLNMNARRVVWSPVRVLHWERGQVTTKIVSMENQTSGRIFDVSEILPYTPETAKACRDQGHYVLESNA
ncbi:hypothetical protein BDQ17DRAFT_1376177 [Cyathus striatus]|nr:hypothetical protein BDQ17DRAFT_1376177 [Cyathus striatus]